MESVQSVNPSQVQSTKFFDPQNNYNGTKIGAIAVATELATLTCLDAYAGKAKFSKFLVKSAKLLPLYLIPAFIVDYLNNNQKQNTEPNAKTENGKDYTKVNMGEKWGAVLGGVAGALSSLINMKELKAISGAKYSPIASLLVNSVISALGGHWLGKITDKYTNKHSVKEADNAKE